METEAEMKARHAAELAELKERKEYVEDPVLRLKVEGGQLNIWCGGMAVGQITPEGRCFILNTDVQHLLLEQWRKTGMQVDDSIVEWRGGEYSLDEWKHLTRIDLMCGDIYNFVGRAACYGCEDTNIQRYSDGKVKLFG